MILVNKTKGALLLILLCAGPALAQLSVGLQYGYVSCTDKNDAYSLSTQWPTGNDGNSLVFFSGGTGTSLLATVGYDVTRYFSVTMAYRMTNFTMPAEHREGSLNSLGTILRINFVDNERKVIPFLQGEFMFINSNTIKQTSTVSTQYPTQTSPNIDQSFSTNLGIGGDLGVEVKLNKAFGIVVTGGFHGVEINAHDKDFTSTLDYGSFVKPSNLDGVFFFQGMAGIKYYFGMGKKKRDF